MNDHFTNDFDVEIENMLDKVLKDDVNDDNFENCETSFINIDLDESYNPSFFANARKDKKSLTVKENTYQQRARIGSTYTDKWITPVQENDQVLNENYRRQTTVNFVQSKKDIQGWRNMNSNKNIQSYFNTNESSNSYLQYSISNSHYFHDQKG